MGNEIRGLTLGLVGIGQIGRRVALLAKAFGMNVIAYDPYVNTEEVKARGATPVSFEGLLSQSDIISVHCPRNAQTLNMFNAKTFSGMKSGAAFISTARGGIHNEVDLYEALKSGKLSGAGLDVWAVEPPEKDNLLLTLPNVVATYHTGGVTHEARFNGAKMAADQIQGLVRGERAPRMINPEVWPLVEEKLHKLLAIA
jgi:D-3-phosphoglycerate dehydrogenase